MAGKRIVPACILLLASALLFLLLGPGSGVKATNWDTTYNVILSDSTPGANADQTTVYNISQLDVNFAQILSSTGSPEAQIALDSEIPDGSSIGQAVNASTLSVYNGLCTTPIQVIIPFMECATDTLNTEPWVGTGDNLVLDCNRDMNEDGTLASEDKVTPSKTSCRDGLDNDGDTVVDFDDPDCIGNCINTKDDNDGDTLIDCADPQCNDDTDDTNDLPSYCDHYPAFLNDMFGDVKPRARYMGHSVVLAGSPATMLEFVIFNPEALGALPTVVGQMGDTYGFIDFVVLDNPIAPVSPSTITDFCGPLTSIPTLLGVTDGSYTVMPGPEPYEAAAFCPPGAGGGVDNDGDGWVDDGCLVKSGAGAGYVRNENPPAHTGLFGTGTHAIRTYSQSQRDVDNDGISNNLDSCPYIANHGVDADNDGLDRACDLELVWHGPGAPPACYNDGIPDNCPSPGAQAPNGNDDDGDGLTDEDPVDNADNDGDFCDHDEDGSDAAGGPGTGNCCDCIENDAVPDGIDRDDPECLQQGMDEDGECKATSGLPDEDQDCYPNRQDICPLTADNQSDTDNPPGGAAADLGPSLDAIGDACDASPNTADGHYHVAMPITYSCIPDNFGADDTDDNGNPDNDGDTVCDSTEDLLGSDKNVAASTPEHIALDLAIATGTPAQAPGTCSDLAVYPGGAAVDNDGDGLTNAADPGCAPIAGDADQDGVPDDVDNCPADQNQEQVDSDGDGLGDDCDADDDNDVVSDVNENCMQTDPKDNSADHPTDDANPYDFDNNEVVDITDALIFLNKFPSAVTDPGDQRYDYDCNHVVDITDALIFLNKFPSSTIPSIFFHLPLTATEPVNDIHIEFFAEITYVASASDTAGGTWTCEKVPPLCANAVDDDGDGVVNDGCRALFGGGETVCDDAVDSDGDTKVNDGCPAVGDPEDLNTGGITYTHGSPSYKVNCIRDSGDMEPNNTLTINLKGKRPPEVRCYDWTADCVVVNSSSKPCNFHVDVTEADDLYVEFGLDLDGDTVSDVPGRSWCDNIDTPLGKIVSLFFPQGIQWAHIPLPGSLFFSDTVRAQWWMPGPWTLQCWYWTLGGGQVGDVHGTCLVPD